MNGVNKYIGMRYVTKFADPIEWDITKSYEHTTAVQYQGSSYISKQPVPIGIPITDTRYWLYWADPNAQIEQYRQEVRTYDARITQAQGDADDAKDTAESALEILAGYAEGDTVKADVSTLQTAIGNVDAKIGTLPEGKTDVVSYVGGEVQIIDTTLAGFDAENPVKTYVDNADREIYCAIDDFKDELTRKLSPMSQVSFDVLSRHFCPDNFSGVQGFCVFESGGVLYWAQSEYVGETVTSQVGIYTMSTHEKVGQVQGIFGHMHAMHYIDGHIYVDASNNYGTRPAYVDINVSNPSSPMLVTPYTTLPFTNAATRICFKTPTQIFHLGGSSGQVWLYDLNDSTDTLVTTLTPAGFNVGLTLQGFDWCEDLNVFTVTVTDNNQVFLFDGATGEQLNVIHVPEFVMHCRIGEIEGAQLDASGKLWVNAAEAYYGTRLATLFEWDFLHGSRDRSFFVRTNLSGSDVYAQFNVNQNTGTLIHPEQNSFLLVSDICNLMKSQGNHIQARIHITSTEYDYPILIENENVWFTASPQGGVTMHDTLRIVGGEVFFTNAGGFTFDGANSEDAYGIIITGGKLTTAVPLISGNVTGEIQATNGAFLFFYNIDAAFTNVAMTRCIAWAHKRTGINVNNSFVYLME